VGITNADSAASQAFPPLPDRVPAGPDSSPPGGPPAAGCHRIHYVTTAGERYDGTLRVDRTMGSCLASGDLYLRDAAAPHPAADTSAHASAGIPLFPLSDYRYYLRVVQLVGAGEGFRLEFEMRRYAPQILIAADGTSVSAVRWPNDGTFVAVMAPANAPSGSQLAGDVVNSEGVAVGTLSMVWVSPYLRKATVEFTRVAESEVPLDNGPGQTWRTVFDKVGWDIAHVVVDRNLEEPSGESWSGAEAHSAMLAACGRSGPDAEWRYQILCVRRIDLVLRTPATTPLQLANGERGYMYDRDSADSDRLPREGLMVASHWLAPNEAKWGLERGLRAGTTVTYFRTAVHEIGHAMGLVHNNADTGFMMPTSDVADLSLETPSTPFPENVRWSFNPDDELRLRHWPDLVVRPGGVSWGRGASAPISSFVKTTSEQHRLDVSPVLTTYPLAAPVRIEVSLSNASDGIVQAPSSVGLTSGAVRGHVIDPAGTVQTFAPLVVDEAEDPFMLLEPGQAVSASLTLLRGRQGVLFPRPGAYRILVEVSWQEDIRDIVVTGETNVVVTAPVDAAHREAALQVLGTPDTLLTLALGGDHLNEGIAAIAAALGNDVLRPHFAYVEAKRLAAGFGGRTPDMKAAAALIDDTTVMSAAEHKKAMAMVAGSNRRWPLGPHADRQER
jgi:hypothetical protein